MKLYVASKLRHQAMWQQLAKDRLDIQITSHWINVDCSVEEQPGNEELLREAWSRNIEDVQFSDYLLVYAENGEPLRGALVEVGAALMWACEILVVGITDGTWFHHPRCHRFDSIQAALAWMKEHHEGY